MVTGIWHHNKDTEGVSSGCEAGGVRDEIARKYADLQTRLGREFSDRHPGKAEVIRAPRPVATEDQLSADYQNKLLEWRMKGVKQPPPIPARKDLSENFLKKLDEWTRMKETNSVPTFEEEAKPDEVLVQTSTGIIKFQGISRSFTRKLHEWEKSRGIAPEASTSALLQEARAKNKVPAALTRTQSDGSVGPVFSSGRVHASSLSVNDVEDLENLLDEEEYEEGNGRGAVLVEIEAEEVCTAAPLVAVRPRHMPQKPVYTYGPAEARLLCETTSAVTGTAVVQSNGTDPRITKVKDKNEHIVKITREQSITEKTTRRKISRQKSHEEDAKFIRKTIEEIERGTRKDNVHSETEQPISQSASVKNLKVDSSREGQNDRESDEARDEKRCDKNNGKKKSKSRARLEREQSKPSGSDTETEVDTVTVEIPRRKKRPRKPSEKPKTPPTSHHSDSEGEVFILNIKTQDFHDKSPEVIVKTKRKIFSPIVRSGETVPTAVIPFDVEDSPEPSSQANEAKHDIKPPHSKGEKEDDEQRAKAKPPLPTSPTSQRKPPPKETSPSIRIMIQRYNKKINEEGPISGGSSGTTSPAWRSPKSERKRPPDMPVGVNIRNNPFLEREVQKSASACQLSRRDQRSAEKCLTPTQDDRVLKSHSANTLHHEKEEMDDSQESIRMTAPSTETMVPCQDLSILRHQSEMMSPRFDTNFGRSISVVEDTCTLIRMTSRAARIKEARERFLSSSPSMRREGTNSASDLRAGDRSSQVSCESEAGDGQGSSPETPLGRSASTGMVTVEREAWQRVAESGSRRDRTRSRFSLARLAAKLRRKDESAVSKLCRQGLLVQLQNKQ